MGTVLERIYFPMRTETRGAESGLFHGVHLHGEADASVSHALFLPCLPEAVGGEGRYLPGDVRGAGDGVMNHYLLIQNALPLQGTEL